MIALLAGLDRRKQMKAKFFVISLAINLGMAAMIVIYVWAVYGGRHNVGDWQGGAINLDPRPDPIKPPAQTVSGVACPAGLDCDAPPIWFPQIPEIVSAPRLTQRALSRSDAEAFIREGEPSLEVSLGALLWVPRNFDQRPFTELPFSGVGDLVRQARPIPLEVGTRLIVLRRAVAPYRRGEYAAAVTETGLWGYVKVLVNNQRPDREWLFNEGALRTAHHNAVEVGLANGRSTVFVRTDFVLSMRLRGRSDRSVQVTFTRGERYLALPRSFVFGERPEVIRFELTEQKRGDILNFVRERIFSNAGIGMIPTTVEIRSPFIEFFEILETEEINSVFPLGKKYPVSAEDYINLFRTFGELIVTDTPIFQKGCDVAIEGTSSVDTGVSGSISLGTNTPFFEMVRRFVNIEVAADARAQAESTWKTAIELARNRSIVSWTYLIRYHDDTSLVHAKVERVCDARGAFVSRAFQIWQSGSFDEIKSSADADSSQYILHCFSDFEKLSRTWRREKGLSPIQTQAAIIAFTRISDHREFSLRGCNRRS